jgi:hypothetical protein
MALMITKARISKGLVIVIDASGKPRLCGVSLANTNLQKLVYGELVRFRVSVRTTSPNLSEANPQALRNWVRTLQLLNSFGLVTTNGPKVTASNSRDIL